jgi:hypothetical protein
MLYATEKGVWKYCNPATEAGRLPEPLEEPDEPEYPRNEEDDKAMRLWRDRNEAYKGRWNRWTKQHQALIDVNNFIFTYVDASIREPILQHITPYTRLVYLQKRFARSNSYKEEMRMK